MAEITAALDEAGAGRLLEHAVTALGPRTLTGQGALGPLDARYTATGRLSSGAVDLIPPDTVRIAGLRLDWHLDLSFSFDLSSILPDFCLPQVCVDVPCVGRVCTPRICVDWPTITIPVSFGDFLQTTADFKLDIALVGGQWRVQVVLLGIPSLQFGASSAALLLAIGAAATPILLAVPFIGPFLAVAVDGLLAVIALAGVTGFLGPILGLFLAGLTLPVYQQPKAFEILPADGPTDPRVVMTIDALAAAVQHDGAEDELVLTADVSP